MIRVRFLAVLLACALSMGLLFSAGAAYEDVGEDAWYAADVAAMEEYGILNGVGNGRFDPEGRLTLAQAVAIVCRVSCYTNGIALPPQSEGDNWYENYLTFAEEKGICLPGELGDDLNTRCNRFTMATLFARVFPEKTACTLNTVERLPDLAKTEATAGVYRLYEQGVLTGNDASGLFFPTRSITRGETAAILHRLLDASQRKQFTLQERDGGVYVPCKLLQRFGNYLTLWPRTIEMSREMLESKADSLNAMFARHPELTFYVYYIEKDTDLNFQTGVLSGISDTFLDTLKLPMKQKDAFEVSSFQRFADTFYRTDTHWKAQGSYQGYLELLELLRTPGEPLRPNGDLITLSNDFQGKKAIDDRVDGYYAEPFRAYAFPYPPMKVTVNGKSMTEYGQETAYLSGTAKEPVSYGNFYGWDRGEVVLSSGKGTENLLAIGESFDNPVVKLLTNHYKTVYSVDLRWYEAQMGKRFDLTAYTKERNITKVLLIGNIDYFLDPVFTPETDPK